MTDETISPIAKTTPSLLPLGRRADLFATLIAALGAILSVVAALWFFLGFAQNDTRFEHLASALVLTLMLFTLAIAPFSLVAGFGRHAYRKGSKRAHLIWTLLLMLPWVGLGVIAVTHTPLPIWCGLLIAGLAALLSLWALASIILDRNEHQSAKLLNTDISPENEMPSATK